MQPLLELAFWVRNRVTFTPPALRRTVPLASLRGELDGQALAVLEARYPLATWEGRCGVQDWRESLYVLDVLRQHLPPDLPQGRALDVGAKNGGYLPGLATALPRGWDAVELDAHRRYLWGATRRAYGEAMAAHFPGCRFLAGDVRGLEGPWAFVSWFLPFLSEAPLEAWDLPRSQLAPEALLRHVTQRVLPGGALLVVNQGAHERELQAALFERLGLEAQPLGAVTSAVSPFRKERFGFLWRRPPGFS